MSKPTTTTSKTPAKRKVDKISPDISKELSSTSTLNSFFKKTKLVQESDMNLDNVRIPKISDKRVETILSTMKSKQVNPNDELESHNNLSSKG